MSRLNQKRRWHLSPTAMTVLAFAAMVLLPMTAGAITLDLALNYGVVSEYGDVVFGNSAQLAKGNSLGRIAGNKVTLGNGSMAASDVVAAEYAITLANYAKVSGFCTAFDAVHLGVGAKCGTVDQFDPDAAGIDLFFDLSQEIPPFESAVLGITPTQTLGPLTVAAGKRQTIATTVAGLNIIQLDSLTLKNSSTLTLSGNSGDTIIVTVSGNLLVGSGAHIRLGGSVHQGNVLIYVQGNSTLGNSTVIGASMLTDGTFTAGSGTFIDGAVLAQLNVTFGPNATVSANVPQQVGVPNP
jgi:hypothetical protein